MKKYNIEYSMESKQDLMDIKRYIKSQIMLLQSKNCNKKQDF